MQHEDKIYDFNGTRILKGARVLLEWDDEEGGHYRTGTVDHITDADGDVDDEGRPYEIGPKVFVKWDKDYNGDGSELEGFSTFGMSCRYEAGQWYECDELEVRNDEQDGNCA